MEGIRIVTTGQKVHIDDENLYAAIFDKNNDIIVFYRPDFQDGGEEHYTIDGSFTILNDQVQSVTLVGPKVRIIQEWLRDQVFSVGRDDLSF